MPPPGIPPAAGFSSGKSTISEPMVMAVPAIETAFKTASLVTLAGSTIPFTFSCTAYLNDCHLALNGRQSLLQLLFVIFARCAFNLLMKLGNTGLYGSWVTITFHDQGIILIRDHLTSTSKNI